MQIKDLYLRWYLGLMPEIFLHQPWPALYKPSSPVRLGSGRAVEGLERYCLVHVCQQLNKPDFTHFISFTFKFVKFVTSY